MKTEVDFSRNLTWLKKIEILESLEEKLVCVFEVEDGLNSWLVEIAKKRDQEMENNSVFIGILFFSIDFLY